ncbi:hypothetical protein, partial [Neorhodopirellula lusitana]|uniref:hypothetical protein n=1 Tax=Neorhodopirellula lusitana TaxID=445327 RepID=UPI0024B83A13
RITNGCNGAVVVPALAILASSSPPPVDPKRYPADPSASYPPYTSLNFSRRLLVLIVLPNGRNAECRAIAGLPEPQMQRSAIPKFNARFIVSPFRRCFLLAQIMLDADWRRPVVVSPCGPIQPSPVLCNSVKLTIR